TDGRGDWDSNPGGTLQPPAVFKTAAFVRSAIPPCESTGTSWASIPSIHPPSRAFVCLAQEARSHAEEIGRERRGEGTMDRPTSQHPLAVLSLVSLVAILVPAAMTTSAVASGTATLEVRPGGVIRMNGISLVVPGPGRGVWGA